MLQNILIGLVAWSAVSVVVGFGLAAFMGHSSHWDDQLTPAAADRGLKKSA